MRKYKKIKLIRDKDYEHLTNKTWCVRYKIECEDPNGELGSTEVISIKLYLNDIKKERSYLLIEIWDEVFQDIAIEKETFFDKFKYENIISTFTYSIDIKRNENIKFKQDWESKIKVVEDLANYFKALLWMVGE